MKEVWKELFSQFPFKAFLAILIFLLILALQLTALFHHLSLSQENSIPVHEETSSFTSIKRNFD